jgi:DNA mismatch repair protein MSH2
MLECSAILGSASPHSLVIVDELGRGTSTFDGFGLAWAIAEELACRRRCLLLFATHFHELTQLAAAAPRHVANVHVSAETQGEQLLRFLYRVAPGACERSFGVAIARLAGLPATVVGHAEAKAQELETLGAGSTQQQQKVAGSDDNGSTTMKATLLGAGILDANRRAALLDVAVAVANGNDAWSDLATRVS